MNKSILAAIEKIYNKIGNRNIIDYIRHEYLTENTCRNGRDVLWFMDEDNNVAIYIDTLEFLTEEEIEEQLC